MVKKRKLKSPKKLNKVLPPKNAMKIALRDLVLFGLLSIMCFALYLVSGEAMYQDAFYLLSIIFGFVAVAFLIVILVILISKGIKQKNK